MNDCEGESECKDILVPSHEQKTGRLSASNRTLSMLDGNLETRLA